MDYRKLVPKRNVAWEHDENDKVALLQPKFRNSILVKYVLPRMKHPNFRIKLDDVGSWVWDQIDEKSTVEEIGKRLKAVHGEKIEPVWERLQLFLNALAKSGFITLLYSVEPDLSISEKPLEM